MVSKKRKLEQTSMNGNDSDGSDYEVEWQVKPKPKPTSTSKADQFPLPAQVQKSVQKAKRGGQDSSSEEEDADVPDDKGLPTLTTAQIDGILETIKNNKRLVLMVSNVNFSTAKEEIEDHFSQAGKVKAVRIPKRRSSGFAFVEMLDPVGFQKAFLLDGTYLDGRQISVHLSESGKKKSVARIKLLLTKNAEIRKMRKKNKHNAKAAAISLVPEADPNLKKVPPPDKFLDKPKQKMLSKKEAKMARRKVSMKAKLKNLSQKGLKA